MIITNSEFLAQLGKRIYDSVKEIEPNAFISQFSTTGVYGESFDVMKSK